MVSDTAGRCGKVWMCGWEKVERYVWREDFWGKRGGKEAWKSGLKYAEGYNY